MSTSIGDLLLGIQFSDYVPRYTVTDLEANLASGVGTILAGVGGNYALNVDTTNNLITIAHKQAVYGGGTGISTWAVSNATATPAIAITAAGIAMGYNRVSDGHWVDAVSINASGNASFSGAINATSGNFTGTVNAGSIITGSVTIAKTAGGTTTLDAMISAGGYTSTQLNTDLAAGVQSILAGSGSDYRMHVDTVASNIILYQKDVVYNGTSSVHADGQCAIAISSAGIAMGYNDPTTGVWKDAITISASGNASFSGTINATSGNFTGTVNAGSVISGNISSSATINSLGIGNYLNSNVTTGTLGIAAGATANTWYYQTTAPGAAINGDFWYDTTATALKFKFGGSWYPVGDLTAGKTAASIASQGNFATINQITSANGSTLIAAGAIAADRIVANSITATQIAAGTITATQIAAGYVYAGTINATQINAGVISAAISIGTAGYIWATGHNSGSGMDAAIGGSSTVGMGVAGLTSGAGVAGVVGQSNNTSSPGVLANSRGNSPTYLALEANGYIYTNSTSLVANLNSGYVNGFRFNSATTGGATATFAANKPGSNSTCSWVPITNTAGTTIGYMPFWT